MEFEGSESMSLQQHLSKSSAGEGSSITKKTEPKQRVIIKSNAIAPSPL